jgi:drug/metabolite transporter (DMT)-like permease
MERAALHVERVGDRSLAAAMLAVASIPSAAPGTPTRFPVPPMVLRVYLVAYFLILAAALASLWQGRVLSRLPAGWVILVVAVAVILGVLLALVSRSHPPNPA